MRFMIIAKANADSEAGNPPPLDELMAMSDFCDGLTKSGVMLAAEGLHPSSKGARIRFAAGKHVVTDGPFAEAKELIAGYIIIQVKSKEEAVALVKRAPWKEGDEIELRQVWEVEDIAPEASPEQIAEHKRMAELAAQNRK